MTKKYLDSNIFIYPILYEDETSENCKRILLDLLKGKFKGYTSILTWDEFVHTIKKHKGKEISISEGKKFLKFSNLTFIKTHLSTIYKAQKIFTENNVGPRDAIHAATALLNNIDEIITGDPDFDAVKEIKRISPENFK
ncbi:type II toxin-antitoxin system VapC family toxin [Candidatus Pacearchaeota archaeon]|nr:type II toxin-antitoxin system VapC family toxin [Candidatus Pacearchaeota archaeon]